MPQSARVLLQQMFSSHFVPRHQSLSASLTQKKKHHECGECCQRRHPSLSRRCEYFVRVPLCLCIITERRRVVYNLSGEIIQHLWKTQPKQRPHSIDVFVWVFFHPLCLSCSLIHVQPDLMQFHENKHCGVNFINFLRLSATRI